MTDTQLCFAIGVPVVSNAIMLLLFSTMINARLSDLRDLFRADLHRVEEVLDARLKHIEEM
jgi:hypothetical protein